MLRSRLVAVIFDLYRHKCLRARAIAVWLNQHGRRTHTSRVRNRLGGVRPGHSSLPEELQRRTHSAQCIGEFQPRCSVHARKIAMRIRSDLCPQLQLRTQSSSLNRGAGPAPSFSR